MTWAQALWQGLVVPLEKTTKAAQAAEAAEAVEVLLGKMLAQERRAVFLVTARRLSKWPGQWEQPLRSLLESGLRLM